MIEVFCGECGFKNEPGAKFCAECGKPLNTDVKAEEKKAPKKVTPKERKPMSKKTKIGLTIGIIVVILLIIGFVIGKNLTDPKKIASDYFEAAMNYDADKLYSYLDVKKSEFTDKKVFTSIINRMKKDNKEEKITNYKVTKAEKSSSGLSMYITITYTEEGKTTDQTEHITLTKEKENKFLFFDNWKIADNTLEIVDDFELSVLKDSTVTLEGVKVDKKYIDKEESTSSMDVYKLPALFSLSYQMKIELPFGFSLEDELNVNTYSHSQTIHFDEDNIPAKEKTKMINQAKKDLKTIYQGVIDNKNFDDMNSNFEGKNVDLDDLKEAFEDLKEDMTSYSTTTLKKIDFKDMELRDLELDDDGYLTMYLYGTYDYTVSYDDNGETKEKSKSSSDGIYVSYSYVDDTYHLVDVSSLPTYFSRYF